ncbi:hypothetical protein FC46_GL001179 [Lactobacillus kalixensis DSM 16043]|uniref:Uncharacterized protein n=1 Tax=Lactobacillus kalixensis DSM 16043 TaxID=1423763 RepID=A0A0R1UER1_9LACO|nr:hypothetical protein FC46_GL001179 [Lactobacillus kalixensis DSM 16043]
MLLGCTQFKIAGPRIIPESSCPITAGKLKRANSCPNRTVASKNKISSPINSIFFLSLKNAGEKKKLPRRLLTQISKS